MVSSSEPVAARSDVQLAKAMPDRCPKSLAIAFAVKTFDCLLARPSGAIARWPAGAWTWTQTWTLPPDQQVVKVCQLQNPRIIYAEFKFFLGLLKMPKLMASDILLHLDLISAHFGIAKPQKEVYTQSRNQGIFLQFWQTLSNGGPLHLELVAVGAGSYFNFVSFTSWSATHHSCSQLDRRLVS